MVATHIWSDGGQEDECFQLQNEPSSGQRTEDDEWPPSRDHQKACFEPRTGQDVDKKLQGTGAWSLLDNELRIETLWVDRARRPRKSSSKDFQRVYGRARSIRLATGGVV
ncbi:unnamed protein product [Caenorhabditis auriculariae]|uniref:Uncharacterized protein n=1 Tax=Caenorhabditis auriculariae TaxID=2777116 RepID=A0A8S1HN85_9PELO|nr:unnamed protein product [Caenorhabditis auriculariae]